jgi:hypothetical protein
MDAVTTLFLFMPILNTAVVVIGMEDVVKGKVKA